MYVVLGGVTRTAQHSELALHQLAHNFSNIATADKIQDSHPVYRCNRYSVRRYTSTIDSTASPARASSNRTTASSHLCTPLPRVAPPAPTTVPRVATSVPTPPVPAPRVDPATSPSDVTYAARTGNAGRRRHQPARDARAAARFPTERQQ
jgi:hypothetical protein